MDVPTNKLMFHNNINFNQLETKLNEGKAVQQLILQLDEQEPQIYALKRLTLKNYNFANINNQTQYKQLANEQTHLISLNHNNIIKQKASVIISGNNQRYLYGILLENGNLDLQRVMSKLNLSLKKKLDISKQVLQGLAYIHGLGLRHNNVKMENVLIFDNDTCKLIDFSYASNAQYANRGEQLEIWKARENLLLAPEFCQMLHQKLEEKVLKNNALDESKQDVFMAGMILYQMILPALPPINKNDPKNYSQNLEKMLKSDKFSKQLESMEQDSVKRLNIMNLLSQLLNVSPDKRISASEALNNICFQ